MKRNFLAEQKKGTTSTATREKAAKLGVPSAAFAQKRRKRGGRKASKGRSLSSRY